MGRPAKTPWIVTWKHEKTGYRALFNDSSGKPRRYKTNTHDMLEAATKIDAVIKDMRTTLGTTETPSKTITLKEAIQRITLEKWQYQKDWRTRQNQAENILRFFGDSLCLNSLQEDTINKYEKHLLAKGNKGATINRKMSILKGLCNRAYKHWRILDRVPVFPHHKEKTGGHKRKITNQEFELLLDYVDRDTGLLIELMKLTGLRPSEAYSLTLESFDYDNRAIILKDTKAGNDRLVPVPSEIFFRFTEYLKYGGVISYGHIRKQWDNAKKKMGLQDDKKFTIGALRHTFAHQLIEEKYPAPVVQAYLGHSSITTTQSYFTQASKDLLRIRDEREI
jgi:integrase